ncbi:hypothetical protein STSP_68910 [Streptomyces jeddahensis]|uniref:Uncharacterized protein n=1 Tax=Streptomyces jeddahensis TaxID=1716141 RepID=A0A177HG02_9ACTN|nr:hypothetical protein STSP_68910 [Streptomyces jeddahensis]
MSRGWAKRHVIEGLGEPGLMSLDQLRAEVAALVRADEASARRWACEQPGCDGLPHEGWLHHHARAAKVADCGGGGAAVGGDCLIPA